MPHISFVSLRDCCHTSESISMLTLFQMFTMEMEPRQQHVRRARQHQQHGSSLHAETGMLVRGMQHGAGAGATNLDELPGEHSRDAEDFRSRLDRMNAVVETGQPMNLEDQLGSQYDPPRALHLQFPYEERWSHAHETQSDSAYYTGSERRGSIALSTTSGHYVTRHGRSSSGAMSPMIDPSLRWFNTSTSSGQSVLDYDSSQNDAHNRGFFGSINGGYPDIDLNQTHGHTSPVVQESFRNQWSPHDGSSEDPLDYTGPQITPNPPGANSATVQDTTSAGPSGKQYRCMFRYAGCESSFGRKQDWKKHLTSRHHLEHPAIYRCTVKDCNQPADYVFSRKDHLKEHLKKIHHLAKDSGLAEKDVVDLEKKIEPRMVPDFLRCSFCLQNFRQEGMLEWPKVLHHISQHYLPNSTQDWVPYPEFKEWAEKESMLSKMKPRRTRR
jgi:hypothetical protein